MFADREPTFEDAALSVVPIDALSQFLPGFGPEAELGIIVVKGQRPSKPKPRMLLSFRFRHKATILNLVNMVSDPDDMDIDIIRVSQ